MYRIKILIFEAWISRLIVKLVLKYFILWLLLFEDEICGPNRD